MKIRNGSIELHVAEDGDPSAPPILLLHGITSFGGTWDWIVPALVERFRVLRLDFRGHGESDRAPGEYDPSGYLSDAVATLEHLAGGPCIVMGHSLGGAIAAVLAQRHPDLLRAVVLEDPPLWTDAAATQKLEGNSLLDGFRLMRASIPQLQAAGLTAEVVAGILAAAPSPSGPTFGEALYPDGIASMAGSLLRVDATVLDPVLDGTIGELGDADAPFSVPALIICADPAKPDAVADPQRAAHFARISSATEYVVLAGAGHLIHDEIASRDRFREIVMSYIDRVASS